MQKPYYDLQSFDFVSLSEVKTKLSEQIERSHSKRIAITNHGKPVAVLLSYQDYLNLLGQLPQQDYPTRTIDYEEWKRGSEHRKKVSRSILNLFDMSKLSRKGQKKYKRDAVSEVNRSRTKRA